MLCLACISHSDAGPMPVEIEQTSIGYAVTMAGKPFTQFIQGEQKPYLYPVIGPTGINMTRDFPFELSTAGEKTDHPWHTSVYFTHGSVNGLDFWNDKTEQDKACRIERIKVEKAGNLSPYAARLLVSHKWIHGDETQMTDQTEILFSGDDSKRIIDYKITLIASHGDVTLGDTKEGCMAVRMHHKFRVRDQSAKAVNSEGIEGKAVWGKKARWITYYNEIEGETLGISMLDHPDNLRYPTNWHARDYGLCAANAFGLKYYTPDQDIDGTVAIKAGERLTFSYRLIFHRGSHEEAHVDALHKAWTNG